MKKDGAVGQVLILVVVMVISLFVTFGSNGLIGSAVGTFAFILLTILDSIDSNLAEMNCRAAEMKKVAETYNAKGEKVDVPA